MEGVLSTSEISSILKEISAVKENYLQEEELATETFCNNFKSINKGVLSLEAMLILDLKVSGLKDTTLLKHLISLSIKDIDTHMGGHMIHEVKVCVPQIHFLRVSPISNILNSIEQINKKTCLKITDNFGLICRTRRGPRGKEFLNPNIKTFDVKGHFNFSF
jgi:hypothetical protein